MHHFIQSVPLNKNKLRMAVIFMLLVIISCAVGVVLSRLYWNEYTHEVYSLKHGRNITTGWPATVYGWGLFIGIAFALILPLLFFMQDWKNPSLAITQEGLFINQQMIKNVIVPFSNIREIENKETGYHIYFKDNEVVCSQSGAFKALVRQNLKQNGLAINEDSTPELDRFFSELGKRVG
ncbi:MAG: hypothetical protein K0S32_3158 [Bacteroidetes bacterium]|jgi:hypothetical protein|nr:hypothetical protein [Bacteroidota bacterium]